MANFSKVSEREVLKPRRDPYWHKLRKGGYLGYRKMSTSSTGNWSARIYDESTDKQLYRALGDFSELPEHERFDAASKAAMAWFDHLGHGGTPDKYTVQQACERYVRQLRRERGDTAADDAQSRFKRYVLDDARLANTELSKLTAKQIDNWRERLEDRPALSGANRGGKRSKSALNRDMTCFRAALNLALEDGLVTSALAWRAKLRPVKDADGRRDGYLDRSERRLLIDNATPDLSILLKGMCLLPLRPGALAVLTVKHFDKRLSALTIGKDKAGKDRKITLPPQTAAFITGLTKGKLPAASLFVRDNGKPWDKDAWKHPVKDAARAAELPPSVTIYILRHSVITDLVHGGLDLLTVAQISGTSVKMIEQHYGHLRSHVASAALAQLAL